MSAGDDPGGELDAGDDYPDPDAFVVTTAPSALVFNPQTRAHDQDADGNFVGQHPIDAAVVNALMIRLGKVPSAPKTGLGVWKIPSHFAVTAEREANDWVKLALKDLIEREDIRLLNVSFGPLNASASFLSVVYVNLRLPPYERQTVRIPTSG